MANFHSYLTDVNADSMGWRAIIIAIERVETANWENDLSMTAALKTVKAIGLLNIFGSSGFSMPRKQLIEYMKYAMAIDMAEVVLEHSLISASYDTQNIKHDTFYLKGQI